MPRNEEVTIEEIESIKEQLEKEEREYQRLQGKLEAATDELKKLGYSSITAAEKALDKLEKEVEKQNTILRGLLDGFRDKYPILFASEQ